MLPTAIEINRRKQEVKIAKRLFLVVMSDFICWFPIGIMGNKKLEMLLNKNHNKAYHINANDVTFYILDIYFKISM